MKSKGKFILPVLFVLLVSFLLSACHGSKKTAAFVVPDKFDTAKEQEITFWAKNDTNKAQTNIYEKAIEDFEALYPNIKVNLRLYTDYGKIYNDVITNIATGTTPDVCITYPDHIATYKTGSNVVVPLDQLITDEKYGLGGSELAFDSPSKDEVIPEFLDECIIDGSYYALPYMRSTEACYVNRNMVEALGYELPEVLTWDFVWEVSEAAMKKDADGNFEINGQKVLIPFIYKSTDNMMISMLKQTGAPFSNDAGEILIFNDRTKEILETVAKHGKTKAFSTFKISSYPANFLNAGQCIFAIDSTAGATWMGSDAPNSDIAEDKFVRFDTEVMMIPQVDPEHPQMISQGPSLCVFNKEDPQRVLASWIFAQYMLTNEVQIAYSQTEGYIPVTGKAQNSDEYRDYIARAGEDTGLHYDVKIKASKLMMEHTADTFVTAVFNGSASLRDAAGQMIESTVKSVRRNEKVDDAYFVKLYDDINSLYHLDQINVDGGTSKTDLGPLPGTAVALLSALVIAWICILVYVITEKVKAAKSRLS